MAKKEKNSYFTRFHVDGFELDATAPFEDEFDRLSELRGWVVNGLEYREQQAKARAIIDHKKEVIRNEGNSEDTRSTPVDVEPVSDGHQAGVSRSVEPVQKATDPASLDVITALSNIEPDSQLVNSASETASSSGQAQLFTTEITPESRVPSTISNTDTSDEAAPKISKFFLKFVEAGFVPNPLAKFDEEFDRLATLMGWERKRKRGDNDSQRVGHLYEALESEFATHCGPVNDLASWQALCGMVAIDPVPTSISDCEDELLEVNACITCLIGNLRTLSQPQAHANAVVQIPVYSSTFILSAHCHAVKHVYPRRKAEEKGFLGSFLRPIGSSKHESLYGL